MSETHDSFLLYADYSNEVMLLPMEDRGLLLTALFCYVNGEQVPELDLATTIVWSMWKKNIDRNTVKWEETRQRRSAAGRKGGLAAHKHMKTMESNANQTLANQAVPVPDPVSVPVPDSVPISVSPARQFEYTSLPLKNGSEYIISAKDMENWQENFPSVDLEQEFCSLKGWLTSCPDKQLSSE